MMSDEEKRDDVYVRHQPEYRSEKFTAFLNKLDSRSSKKQTSHARYKRSIGTPVKKTPPFGIMKWMTKPTESSAVQESSSSESENDVSGDNSDIWLIRLILCNNFSH